MRLLIIGLLCSSLSTVFGKTLEWIPDQIQWLTNQYYDASTNSTGMDLTVTANGALEERRIGQYRLLINATQIGHSSNLLTFIGHSDCLSLFANPSDLKNQMFLTMFLPSNTFYFDSATSIPMSQLFSKISVKKYYYLSNSTYSKTTWSFKFQSNYVSNLVIGIDYAGCDRTRTVGNWNDKYHWNPQYVPSTSDTVILPEGSGVIVLQNNVIISSFKAYDGLLMAYATACPDDWSIDPNNQGTYGTKCYKLITEPMPYAAAQSYCQTIFGANSGSSDLMEVKDRNELSNLLRICRGIEGSQTYLNGCWIGLRDPDGFGNFDWINLDTVSQGTTPSLFLDWRRNEPNNHTVSDGIFNSGGESCVNVIPWQTDPLIQEQGSWNDDGCELLKPFICQVVANTTRYLLTVTRTAILNGSSIEGGILYLVGSGSQVIQYMGQRSAVIVISPAATDSYIRRLYLHDGTSLLIQTDVVIEAWDAFIGEYTDSNVNQTVAVPSGIDYLDVEHDNFNTIFNPMQLPLLYTSEMQPLIVIDSGVLVSVVTVTSNSVSYTDSSYAKYNSHGVVLMNCPVQASGSIQIGDNTTLIVYQGGDFSQSTIIVVSETSTLQFDGYASKLFSYDAFELVISNRGQVIGEFYGNSYQDLLEESNNQYKQLSVGVYKLQVSNLAVFPNIIQVSSCIPYNATESQLEAILNALPLIASRGFVTVRRYGNGASNRYEYGYTYRIEMDAPTTHVMSSGSLDMNIYCIGSDLGCNCATTKVSLLDSSGQFQCPYTGNSSCVDPDTCVYPPALTISKLSAMSYSSTLGKGSIVLTNGVHRLPPISKVTIETSGTSYGVVASDVVIWSSLRATQYGQLIMAGQGWRGWSASYLLYSPEWTYGRGFTNELLYETPTVNLTAENFFSDDEGQVLISCPNSSVIFNYGQWNGGIIGGLGEFNITSRLNASHANKRLRYGVSMFISATAVFYWNEGNISLSEGSMINILGEFIIDSATRNVEVLIGETVYVEPSVLDFNNASALSPGRSWHGYFDKTLPTEIWGGWYTNPICGTKCLNTNEFSVSGSGKVITTTNSTATFLLPFQLLGSSNLVIGYDVHLNIASGGVCGDGVTIDINAGTTLSLSGGEMQMQAKCTIRGQGELLVTGGSHDLAFVIDAHITLSGGTLLWPLSRGTKGTIAFNGGLLIKNTGLLEVQPFSTTILVHEEVQLQDQGIIQFPLIEITTQSTPFDEADAPDSSPRGNLTATGIMKLYGGTLLGKANFNSLKALYLDVDDKYIKSLAKLINYGHCEWGYGNLIASDNGDFQNFGTVQMQYGVNVFDSNAMYQGTELPVVDGGDPFALNFHSWDLDPGGLNYDAYVQLRTEFVSRAPNGWNISFQG